MGLVWKLVQLLWRRITKRKRVPMMSDSERRPSRSKKALYVTVYEKLYKLIMEGSFPSGQLPSEPRLAELLGVSRVTLRQAIALLRDDGLIRNVHGKGNFITATPRTQAAGGLERFGHPFYKCCTVKIDEVEAESRIDFPNDYIREILERPTSAIVVFHRWYKSKGKYVGYSLSFIPIETLSRFEIDTSQEARICEFLETGIYGLAERSTLEIHASGTGDFISEKHVISDQQELPLIVERVYGEIKIPLLVSKHYLNTAVCSIVVNASLPDIGSLLSKRDPSDGDR